MMKLPSASERFNTEAGETLMGLLVGSFISFILLAAATSTYLDSSRRSYDHQIIAQTRDKAKAVLDLLAFDIRMTGSGMPLNQSNFQIGGSGLGTAPNPILISATATSITLRRNEQGISTVLTASFLPSTTSTTMSVASSADIEVGDTIYLSDANAGGSAGLRGVVSSKTSSSITIQSSYIATASTTFATGSTVERITEIALDSPVDNSGITRDSGGGDIVIAPNTQFSLSFYDSNGTELVLPLTDAVLRDSLSSIRITVTATSRRTLKTGTSYTAQVSQRVGLRNLYLSR